jgi:putative membrane protein
VGDRAQQTGSNRGGDSLTKPGVFRDRGRRDIAPGFYIVSSWFLDANAASGRQGGNGPEQPGSRREKLAMMGWYGGGMGSLGWLGMGVFWLFLLGLIVWLVVRLLPGSNGGTTLDTGESPLAVLDCRLAGGQIDLELWQTQRTALLAARGQRK